MRRREVLKMASVGVGGALLADTTLGEYLQTASAQTRPNTIFKFQIVECLVEMVTEDPVYMWCYADETGPHFPGPTIIVPEGQSIFIELTNTLTRSAAFSIPGVLNLVARPGQTVSARVRAPRAACYLYYDSLNAPLNRVMGLHGVLITTPRHGHAPYSDPTPAITQLFNNLSNPNEFAHGEAWKPENTTIWLFTEIDPDLNEQVRSGNVRTGYEFGQRFTPTYFTINGRSGYFSAHSHDTAMHSVVGRPRLLRMLNAGLWAHSLHVHGNHAYTLGNSAGCYDNLYYLETWTLPPTDCIDVLYPFIQPPDIPPAVWQRYLNNTSEEGFPIEFPAHCHTEMSQTARGGNYPHGAVSHIVFEGIAGHEVEHHGRFRFIGSHEATPHED